MKCKAGLLKSQSPRGPVKASKAEEIVQEMRDPRGRRVRCWGYKKRGEYRKDLEEGREW